MLVGCVTFNSEGRPKLGRANSNPVMYWELSSASSNRTAANEGASMFTGKAPL